MILVLSEMREAPRHAFTELNFEALFIEYEKDGRALSLVEIFGTVSSNVKSKLEDHI